jgi:hypothetical protein
MEEYKEEIPVQEVPEPLVTDTTDPTPAKASPDV